jgi:biopolymer transport protein TolR
MRRARKSINQINVVPYIDVMLVLLVIFMITAPLVNPGQIELPTVGSKLTAPPLPLQIQIGKKGDYTFRDTASKSPPMVLSESELIAELKARQAGGDRPVVIAAPGSARYEEVIHLIDTLQRSGIRKVGLLAESKPG